MRFNAVTFWDYRPQYHDQFTAENNFKQLQKNTDNYTHIYLGITKYNFFCLKKYVQYFNKTAAQKITDFSVIPVHSIVSRLKKYIQRTQRTLKKYALGIAGPEAALWKILQVIQDHWNEHQNNDLLRILGILCDHVFIGPHILHVDMSNTCNIDCLYCWFHSPKIKRKQPQRTVPFQRFQQVIDEAAAMHTDEILLLGEGEPFMDSNIVSHIAYIKQKDLKLELFTNGTMVDRHAAETIVSHNVDHVYFSISAATAETYKELHPSVDISMFDTIVNNLSCLAALKKEAETPRMTYLFVVTNKNYHEIFKTVELAAQLKFNSVRFQLVHGGDNDFNSYLFLNNEQIQESRTLLKKAHQFAQERNIDIFENIDFQLPHLNADSGNWSEDHYLEHGCFIGWYLLFFRQQGHFSFCCAPKLVNTDPSINIKDLWFSDEYMKYRTAAKYMKKNKQLLFKNNEPLFTYNCQRCENYDHINKMIDLLKHLDLFKYVKE